MFVCQYQTDPKIIKLISDRSPDDAFTQTNRDGKNALDIARQMNNTEFVKILEQRMMRIIGKDMKTINQRSTAAFVGLTKTPKNSQGNAIPNATLPPDIVSRMMKQSKQLMPPRKTPTSKKSDPTHNKKKVTTKRQSV
jgi:hypothetical protein